jgi:acetate---CoA ligase (ADP-forming)
VEADSSAKPLAVFLSPQADASLKLLHDAGVAGFRTPEACADAIRAWRDWRTPAAQPARSRRKVEEAAALLATASSPVNEHDACRVFAALGVEPAATEIIKQPGQRVSIGFPVAAKILSPHIAHKTDARAVRLNVASRKELAAACKEILANARAYRKDAHIEGVLVQRMERGLAEVILGFKHDPQVGPIVMLGAGGVLAEIYRDFALRLAPVDVATASDMIAEVKGLAVIRGYRGLPRGDCAALARAVSAFSQLAYVPRVAEAEINPLLVKKRGEGVVAVDGLLVRRDNRACDAS